MPETNNLNPQYNYPPSRPQRPSPQGPSKVGIVITIVIIVLVAAGAIAYFTGHKIPVKQNAKPNSNTANTGGPQSPYAVSASPSDGFPKELLPAQILGSPQFWSSAQGVGATVAVKAPLAEEAKSFVSSLPSPWQVDSKTVSSSNASFNLSNKTSAKTAIVNMAPLPNNLGTSINFIVAK